MAPRRFAWSSRIVPSSTALLCASISLASGLVALADEPRPDARRLVGTWAVVRQGVGPPLGLDRIAIREAGARDRVSLEPIGPSVPAGDGPIVAASARIGPGGLPEATWMHAGVAHRLCLISTGEASLTLISRERGPSGEAIRQVDCERVGAADRLVAGSPAPGGSTWPADRSAILVVDADGTALRRVAPPPRVGPVGQPRWSPDGTRIAFQGFDGAGRDPLIFVVDARDGRPAAVAAGVSPTWSIDGARIAYAATGKPEFATDWAHPGQNDERVEEIRLAGPDAGRIRRLAAGFAPRFSPIDDRLAFSARRGSNRDVYVRSADGARVDRLTDDPSTDAEPSWSGDGRSILFLSDRGNRWDLYRVDADDRRAIRRLTDHRRREDAADPSPDGRLVAFADALGRPDGRILILDVASGRTRPLLDPGRGDRDPCWSPDGRRIAFSGHRGGP